MHVLFCCFFFLCLNLNNMQPYNGEISVTKDARTLETMFLVDVP